MEPSSLKLPGALIKPKLRENEVSLNGNPKKLLIFQEVIFQAR